MDKSQQKKKFAELHETLPSAPQSDMTKKTIIFHGTLYHFPDYSDAQLNAMQEQMVLANKSYSYAQLNSLLERIAPFRLGPAKRRRPGERITRSRLKVDRK